MTLKSLISHTAQLLKAIDRTQSPPDKIASEYLLQHRYIGSSERKFISETVFVCLRNRILISHIVDFNPFSAILANNKLKDELTDKLKKEILLATSVFLLSEFDVTVKEFYNPEIYLSKINRNEPVNTLDAITYALTELFETENDIAVKFCNEALSTFTSIYSRFSSETIIKDKSLTVKELSLRLSVNEFIINSWIKSGMAYSDVYSLGLSLLQPAPVSLRINSETLSREKVIDNLKNEGIEARPGTLSPRAIILSKRQNITNLRIFRDGIIEVQDEGSQLISYAASPVKSDIVLDACAGAGGKTLHLAAIQNDEGEIVASDTEFNRLKEIRNRAARFGFKSITTRLLKSGAVPRDYINQFDVVLVDAPCSGLGTVRRLPAPKYRLNENLIKKLNSNQYQILTDYSKCVRKGGVLIYSTCSLMPQENQLLSERFLRENKDFKGESVLSVFERHNIKIPYLNIDDYYVTLYPNILGCDGFFIARMRKE